jgi:type III restriction enzyme
LVADEAHRGTDRSKSGDGANSIVHRFILGADEMVRSPIVFGISATPKRFDDLIAGTARTVRRAEADIVEVRASGLIKERVVVWRSGHGSAVTSSLSRSSVLRYAPTHQRE